MLPYILRRLLYAIPILIGINLITFALFFMLNTPDDMARMQLGEKHITESQISRWKIDHGYEKPLFWNGNKTGLKRFTETLFFKKSITLFALNFGTSDQGRDIKQDIRERMWPSLAIALPIFILGIGVHISLALLMVYFRNTYVDRFGMVCCIILMSISSLFYIIGGQFLFAKMLHWVPISGYDTGKESIKFIILPVLVGVLSGIGSGTRWYRTLFLEEASKEYVQTALAKGLLDQAVYFKHILKNAMLPILTGVVVVIPALFMGSLLLESFFGIPGLGSYMIDAIAQQDFAIVRSMVFLGSALYMIGLVLTDLSYVLFDPRVRFE